MLWGQILKSNQISSVSCEATRLLHISNGTLVTHGESDRIFVQLSDDSLRINVASFLVNKSESVNLNMRLLLCPGKEYKLMLINGKNCEVHLSGYFESEEKHGQMIISEGNKNVDTKAKDGASLKSITKNEEDDCEIDNKEIERFLQRKTNKKSDVEPQKMKKMKSPIKIPQKYVNKD